MRSELSRSHGHTRWFFKTVTMKAVFRLGVLLFPSYNENLRPFRWEMVSLMLTIKVIKGEVFIPFLPCDNLMVGTNLYFF